jgi:hypothetical protein
VRLRIIVAASGALALSGLGIAVAGPASANSTMPTGVCMYFTDDGGVGLGIFGEGHGNQPELAPAGSADSCYAAVNAETISGRTYFQLETAVSGGLCLNEGISGEVVEESCSVDGANELLFLNPDDQLEFKADDETISTSSVTAGQKLIQDDAAIGTAENSWEWSSKSPVERVIPVDFNGPTSTDWTAIADSEPEGSVPDAIFEVCYPSAPADCGGNQESNDTAWDSTLTTLHDSGVTPLYYISTGDGPEASGAPTLSELETSVLNAESWYGSYDIGFMFDEVSGSAEDQTFYQDLYNYVDGSGTGDLDLGVPVYMNIGTTTATNYIFGGDEILQMFEDTEASLSSFAMPSWTAGYCTCQFSATVSQTESDSSYISDIETLESDGVGNVYITNETAPPPYDALPPFYSEMTAMTASYDAGESSGSVAVP